MFSSQERSAGVSVAVDLVIFTVRDDALQVLLIERGKEPFTVRDDALQVLLIERGKEPFLGGPALPGGYVRGDEGPDGAAARELFEETGVDPAQLHLEQLRTYGEPGRDPRGRVFSVAYLALGPDLPLPVAGTDAASALWMPVKKAQSADLAFDHATILSDGLERARAKLEYSTVATAFCREPFTVADLRRIYEVVWDMKLEPSNFHRKVTRAEGFLVPTGRHRTPELGRPAALYRRGGATALTPALLR